MKIANLLAAAATAVLLLGALAPAKASTITYRITFSAADFTSSGASTPPVGVVLGELDVTLDLTQSYGGANTAKLNFINIPGETATWLNFNYNPKFGDFAVWDPLNGTANDPSTNDFTLHLLSVGKTGEPFRAFEYTVAGSGDMYDSRTGTAYIREITTPVVAPAATPLPAALPLFVSALGGLGVLGWRRRKA